VNIRINDTQRASLLVLFSILLITSNTDPVTASYGYSRTLLEPFEWEVIWCPGVPNGYVLTILYDAENIPVDFYVVQRDLYNLTSEEPPNLFVFHEVGQRSEILIDGMLGDLYFLVYSTLEQWFEVESRVETPLEKMGRVYTPTIMGVSLIILLGAILVWYRSRKRK
jgi:hypothetical protein